MKVYLFLADDFEEIEALVCVDILRRAAINISTVALGANKVVSGSHGITVHADMAFDKLSGEADMLILPGGPGRKNYYNNIGLIELIKKQNSQNKYIAAICGAPAFLASLDILTGKTVVCYPSEENSMTKAVLGSNVVEVDGNIITSKAAGTTIPFALKLVEVLKGKETREKVKKEILY